METQVLYAYFEEDAPRAYAVGPSDEDAWVRQVADQMLKEYIAAKPQWHISPEDFRLRRKFLGRTDDGALIEKGDWEDVS